MNRIEKFVANSPYSPVAAGTVGAVWTFVMFCVVAFKYDNPTLAAWLMVPAIIINTAIFTWYLHFCINKEKWESL